MVQISQVYHNKRNISLIRSYCFNIYITYLYKWCQLIVQQKDYSNHCIVGQQVIALFMQAIYVANLCFKCSASRFQMFSQVSNTKYIIGLFIQEILRRCNYYRGAKEQVIYESYHENIILFSKFICYLLPLYDDCCVNIAKCKLVYCVWQHWMLNYNAIRGA